jgi:hypothetical protein
MVALTEVMAVDMADMDLGLAPGMVGMGAMEEEEVTVVATIGQEACMDLGVNLWARTQRYH